MGNGELLAGSRFLLLSLTNHLRLYPLLFGKLRDNLAVSDALSSESCAGDLVIRDKFRNDKRHGREMAERNELESCQSRLSQFETFRAQLGD